MRLVKEARLIETPGHRDCLVDIAGYAEAEARIHASREPGATPLKDSDIKMDIYRSGSSESWRLVHVPTGCVGEGDTREEARQNLEERLRWEK